jgi:hypothetical protein
MQNLGLVNNYLLSPLQSAPGVEMRVGVFEGGLKRIRRISFCAPGEFRFRKIVMRSRMRPTGKFSSLTNGRHMQLESPNEKNAFIHLDFRYDVFAFREQACEILYIDGEGNEVVHYPDIDVVTMGGSEIWEVKPKKYADHDWVKRRTDIMQAELAEVKIEYRMKHAEELMREPQLSTMDKILQFGRRPVGHDELATIRSVIASGDNLNWGAARKGAYGPYGREILCRLVLEGRLRVDSGSGLSERTEFVLCPRGVSHG